MKFAYSLTTFIFCISSPLDSAYAAINYVDKSSAAYFHFELPELPDTQEYYPEPPAFTHIGLGAAWFGCENSPCSSNWDYRINPVTGENERISHPPNSIRVLAGTALGSADLHEYDEVSGFDYPTSHSLSIYDGDYVIPSGTKHVYLTFLLGEDYNETAWLYVDYAFIDFRWGYGPNEWWDAVNLEGRAVPNVVPLPATLPMVIFSIAAFVVASAFSWAPLAQLRP